MKNSCSGLRTSFLRPHAVGLLLWALVSGSSCAGPAKQVVEPAPQETDVAPPLVEEFDPRSVRKDLLLIEPAFPPPSRRTATPAVESPVQDGSPASVGKPSGSGIAAPEMQRAYRVQVVALSSETGARELAESLQRQLEVEVTITPHNGLHAVRAGRFDGPDSAEALRRRIAEKRSDFADAFVVREDSHEDETSTPTGPPHGMEPERDLPEPQDRGGARAPGWRVLIAQFLELTEAEEFRRKAVERLDREDVEINFQEPWYKVEVGQFRIEEEASAQELVVLVKRRGFPHALKVRGEVTVPGEDQ